MTILLCLTSSCCLFGTPASTAEIGLASYYGADFQGKKTASGEIFDPREMTCAHPRLPFGTRLRVTNLENNAVVMVRVNDRGPWVAGRIIDLSYAAAQKIGMIGKGVVKVKVEVAK